MGSRSHGLRELSARGFTVEVNRQCPGYEEIGLACIVLGAWFALYRAHFRFRWRGGHACLPRQHPTD